MTNTYKNLTNINYFFILLLPVFFFSRTTLLNIVVILICCIYLAKLFIKKNFFIYNSIILFIILLLYTLINVLFHFGFYSFVQNLAILRFPLFAVAIAGTLLEINEKQFKIFKYIILSVLLFFCLNLLIQYIFYTDIFGFKPDDCETISKCNRFTGLFTRPVAGTYLSYLGAVIIILFARSKYVALLYILIFFFILLSGDRSPLITFSLFSFFSILCLNINRYKKILIYLSVIFIFIFSSFYVQNINSRYFVFFKNLISNQNTNNNLVNSSNNFNGVWNRINATEWGTHYNTAFQIFKDYPIFGSGYRSFRTICKNYSDPINNKFGYGCTTHPHNLYLETLAEQGLVGLSVLIIFILSFVYNIKYWSLKKNSSTGLNFIMCTILILTIFFPFRPFGAFLTTWNTSLLFYCIGFYGFYLKKIKEN